MKNIKMDKEKFWLWQRLKMIWYCMFAFVPVNYVIHICISYHWEIKITIIYTICYYNSQTFSLLPVKATCNPVLDLLSSSLLAGGKVTLVYSDMGLGFSNFLRFNSF